MRLVVTSSLLERWPKATSGPPVGKFSVLQKQQGHTKDGRCVEVAIAEHEISIHLLQAVKVKNLRPSSRTTLT